MTDSPRFNVLVDPWVPLDLGGRTELVSYRDLLVGARDAPGLRHPREDCEYFARMLLSALAQALFGHLVDDRAALGRMLDAPLPASVVDARIAAVRGDFEMVGERPFLQVPTANPVTEVHEGARKLIFDAGNHELFKLGAAGASFEPATALLLLYGALAFAGSGGQGYKASSRGMSPATGVLSLQPIDGPPSIRRDVWANVLTMQHLAALGDESRCERPWAPHTTPRELDDASIVEGLFWMPRAISLAVEPAGTCAATGRVVPWRLRVVGYSAWSAGSQARFLPHPLSPTCAPKKGRELRAFAQLESSRPIWSQLATFLPCYGNSAQQRTDAYRPAPVVDAIRELDRDELPVLLAFAYVFDKATTDGRLFEPFPLEAACWARDLQGVAAKAAADMISVLRLLQHRIAQPRPKRSASASKRDEAASAFPARGGPKKESEELRRAFWAGAEEPFWAMFEDAKDDRDGVPELHRALRSLALDLFDQIAADASDDAHLASQVARARRALRKDLAAALPLASSERPGTGGQEDAVGAFDGMATATPAMGAATTIGPHSSLPQ